MIIQARIKERRLKSHGAKAEYRVCREPNDDFLHFTFDAGPDAFTEGELIEISIVPKHRPPEDGYRGGAVTRNLF